MENKEEIKDSGEILAVVIRKNFNTEGLNFFTPENFPFQLGIHNRKANDIVLPHKHKPFENISIPSQEFFYIESGKVAITLYNSKDQSIKEVILNSGDIILLNCGHKVIFLEKTKLIELKQGPYRGKENEKVFIHE